MCYHATICQIAGDISQHEERHFIQLSTIARMLRFVVSSFTGQDRNKIGSLSQLKSSRVLYIANNNLFRVRLSEFQNFVGTKSYILTKL